MSDEAPRRPYLLKQGGVSHLVDLVRMDGPRAEVFFRDRVITVNRRDLRRLDRRHVLPR